MRSTATTIEGYINLLPPDRQETVITIRNAIKTALPHGYEEAMNWGMICYQVPLSTYPNTYNGQPLMYAAIASQKNHLAIYMTGLYITPELLADFERDYKAAGKTLDMGKSCIRFKKLEDVPLEVISNYIAKVTPDQLIAADQKVHS